MRLPVLQSLFLLPAALCATITACSNSIKISQFQNAANGTMKGLQDATAAAAFSPQEELSAVVQEGLEKEFKFLSHLDKDNVIFAGTSGKSVLYNSASGTFKVVKGEPSSLGSGDWSVAIGDNQYWAMQGGKLLYRNTVGSESAEISDTLENIIGLTSSGLKPVAVSATSFIGVTGGSLLWLTTQPQLRRELFLQLEPASLANHSINDISGGGVIADRGLWLQVKDYVIYVIQDSSGRYYTEKGRMPVLKGSSGPLGNPLFSAIFKSNENKVIAPSGNLVVYSGEKVFTSNSKGAVASQPSDGSGGNSTVGTTPTPSPTPTVAPSPSGPTLAELQTQYNNKFKATFDNRCVACHANRPSRWNTFDAVKLYASQGDERIRSGDMPRGGTLSQTDKTETADFLKALARLP